MLALGEHLASLPWTDVSTFNRCNFLSFLLLSGTLRNAEGKLRWESLTIDAPVVRNGMIKNRVPCNRLFAAGLTHRGSHVSLEHAYRMIATHRGTLENAWSVGRVVVKPVWLKFQGSSM